MDAVYSPSSRG